MFPIKLVHYEKETLVGYIMRLSIANGYNLHSLWKSYSTKIDRAPKMSDIHKLDILPLEHLHLEKLSKDAGIAMESLLFMTLFNMIDKFCAGSKHSDSRIYTGILKKLFCYCPHCLHNKAYIRQHWRFEVVDICIEHNCKLEKVCINCHSEIYYDDLTNPSICPYCLFELASKESKVRNVNIKEFEEQSELQQLIYDLLKDANLIVISTAETAIRLIYLLNGRNHELDNNYCRETCNVLNISFSHLLQLARKTNSNKRSVHFNTLCKILLHTNTCMNEFENLVVPDEFVSMLTDRSIQESTNAIMCNAPWCDSYLKMGSLVETGTKVKRLINGDIFTNHMICKECYCEYAIKDNELVSRGYFIEGYHYITNIDKRINTVTIGKSGLKRIIAYFKVRGLCYEKVHLDDSILLDIADKINQSGNINFLDKYRKWCSKEEFLLYRYHPSTMRALLQSNRIVSTRHDKQMYRDKLNEYCVQLLDENSTVTISRAAAYLGISTNTLAAWSLNSVVHDYKSRQMVIRKLYWVQDIKEKINEYLQNNCTGKILSKDIYNYIGISPSYITTNHPELRSYISELINDEFNILDCQH